MLHQSCFWIIKFCSLLLSISNLMPDWCFLRQFSVNLTYSWICCSMKVFFPLNCSSIITFKVYYKWISVLHKICCVLNNRLVRYTSFRCLIKDHKQNLCEEIVITFPNSLAIYVMERSHMTSAAEGEGVSKCWRLLTRGGGGLSLADVSKNT